MKNEHFCVTCELHLTVMSEKGELMVCIETEKEYLRKVERLLKLLQSEYDLK